MESSRYFLCSWQSRSCHLRIFSVHDEITSIFLPSEMESHQYIFPPSEMNLNPSIKHSSTQYANCSSAKHWRTQVRMSNLPTTCKVEDLAAQARGRDSCGWKLVVTDSYKGGRLLVRCVPWESSIPRAFSLPIYDPTTSLKETYIMSNIKWCGRPSPHQTYYWF